MSFKMVIRASGAMLLLVAMLLGPMGASPGASFARSRHGRLGPTTVSKVPGKAPSYSMKVTTPAPSGTRTTSSGPATSYQFGHYWFDGASSTTPTSNCLYHYEELLSREWISYEVPNNNYPAVGQRYYIKADWGVTGNTCGGGAYVDLEWFLPEGTSFAIDQQNPVVCLGEDIGQNNWTQYPNGCPQNPRPGVQGGMALNPQSTGAWPTATGKEWQIWVPVTSTVPLPSGHQNTLQYFQAYFGFYDGFGNPADARTVQPIVQASSNPYFYYKAPSATTQPSSQYPGYYDATFKGYLNAQNQAGTVHFEAGDDTSYGTNGPPATVSSNQCNSSNSDQCVVTTTWSGLGAGQTIHWRYVFHSNVTGKDYPGGDQVLVIPDTQKPTVSLTAPTEGSTATGTVTLSANASDNGQVAKVDFLVDGKVVGTSGASPYSYSWNTNSVADGQHTLTAAAYDAAGNSQTSAPVHVTVDNPPTVQLTSPSDATWLHGTYTLKANAGDNGQVNHVDFLVDGNVVGTATTSPYTYAWNSKAVADGAHSIAARAEDGVGNQVTSSSVSVIVDNTAPTVSITSPKSGSWVRGTQTVTATAADNQSLHKVVFFLDGKAVSAQTAAPFTYSFDTTTVTYGKHVVAARAYDTAGNYATYNDTLYVDNVAPKALAPAPQLVAGWTATSSYIPARISWSATDNEPSSYLSYRARENVYEGGKWLGWSWLQPTWTTAKYVNRNLKPVDSYQYQVEVQDRAGNVTWSQATKFLVALYQENQSVQYQGRWSSSQAESGALGGKVSSTSAVGAKASLTFTGRSVAVVMPKASSLGTAQVCLDGGSCITVTLSSGSLGERNVVATYNGLSAATHTVTITNQSGTIKLDAIVVLK